MYVGDVCHGPVQLECSCLGFHCVFRQFGTNALGMVVALVGNKGKQHIQCTCILYSEICLVRPLMWALWETTCLDRPHILAEGPTFQCNWIWYQRPLVLRDHNFMAIGWSFKTGSTVSDNTLSILARKWFFTPYFRRPCIPVKQTFQNITT